MSLSVTVTAGKRFTASELVDNAKLNQMAVPTVAIGGSASSDQIGADAVTAAKAAFGAWFYCSASGTNTITLTATGHTITLVEGMIARFKVATDNTSSVDITFGGSTKDLFRYYNSTTSAGVELAAGDLRAGQNCEIIYDGTRWQLLSALGSSQVVVGTDSGSTDAYAITPTPSVRAYADLTGVPVVFKANTVNTGAATLQISGLSSPPTIVKSYNVTLADGDIKAGQWVTVVYDGTNFQLQSPVTTSTPAIVRGVGTSILVKNTSGATGKVDLSCTELVMKSDAGQSQLASALSVTIDIDGGTGLLKRDTGSAAVGWWYVYAVGNGSAASACLSTNSTSPDFTNMTGYSYYARIGAVYCSVTGSPSTLSTLYQVNNDVFLTPTASSSTADTATAWTSVGGVSTVIPPIARKVRGAAGASTASNGVIAIAGNNSGLGGVICGGPSSGVTVISFYQGSMYEVPLITAQTFYYQTNNGAPTYRITMTGYSL